VERAAVPGNVLDYIATFTIDCNDNEQIAYIAEKLKEEFHYQQSDVSESLGAIIIFLQKLKHKFEHHENIVSQ
jgi:hypothetical protein